MVNALNRFKIVHGDVAELLRENVWLYKNTTTHLMEHYVVGNDDKIIKVGEYKEVILINKELNRIVLSNKGSEDRVVSYYGKPIYENNSGESNIELNGIVFNRYMLLSNIKESKLVDILDGSVFFYRDNCMNIKPIRLEVKGREVKGFEVYKWYTSYKEYSLIYKDEIRNVGSGKRIGIADNKYIIVFTEDSIGIAYDLSGVIVGDYSKSEEDANRNGSMEHQGIIKIENYILDVTCKIVSM